MWITVEYRAEPSAPPAETKSDRVSGEFANLAAAASYATGRARSDPELDWVHSIRLHDDSGPLQYWLRDDDA